MHIIHIFIQTLLVCVYYVSINSGDLQIILSRIQEGYNVFIKFFNRIFLIQEQLIICKNW